MIATRSAQVTGRRSSGEELLNQLADGPGASISRASNESGPCGSNLFFAALWIKIGKPLFLMHKGPAFSRFAQPFFRSERFTSRSAE